MRVFTARILSLLGLGVMQFLVFVKIEKENKVNDEAKGWWKLQIFT